MKSIEQSYNDLKRQIKRNKIDYEETFRLNKNLVRGGKSKVNLKKLIKLSGVKVEIEPAETSSIHINFISHIWDRITLTNINRLGCKTSKEEDQILMLIHEIAHGLIHRQKATPEILFRNEKEAQFIAHIVSKHLGLKEISSASMICSLNKNQKNYIKTQFDCPNLVVPKRGKPIRKFKIIKTAERMIECIDQNKNIYQEFFG